MNNQIFRTFILPVVIAVFFLSFPLKAQQPNPPQNPPPAAPEPAPQAGAPQAGTPQPSTPQTGATQNSGSQEQKPDQAAKPGDPKAPDAAIGKSKLEQETGTVNDRLLGVMPNYGTVETSKALKPLTTGQKFRIATASVFDWTALPFNAALAGIAQAKNDPSSWGQGWGAYGKRFGETFADNSIGTYMTTAVFPSLLHEDPRYYQLGKGSITHRAFYAMDRLFVTRKDSGAMGFNYSESVGNAAAAAISNIYHPDQDRTASRNASTFGFLILYDGLANEMKEFWPDIRRKVFHKKNP
jgi:hypothetical protein